MRSAASPWRAAVAGALTGVLALQLALASAGGPLRWRAAMPDDGPHAAAHEGCAGPVEAARLASDDPDADPTPMPCDDEGACDWGLMRCDGAGSCMPLQILPADPAGFGESAVAPITALSSRRAPASLPATVDRPPPRA